jgi:hypothetical protein
MVEKVDAIALASALSGEVDLEAGRVRLRNALGEPFPLRSRLDSEEAEWREAVGLA